ncbi:MAG: hypothetical protein WB780_22350 [Candidatus Acidiferrales bacterium]
MSLETKYELGILTNDGWVVTLASDAPIMLGEAVIQTIVVQPKEDFLARTEKEPDTHRSLYRLNTKGEVVYE